MSFLLTRRSALIGGFSSLIIPTAAVAIEKAVPVSDPWEEAGALAFALHDRLATMPGSAWWFVEVGPGKGPGNRMHFFAEHGRLFHRVERSAS